MRKVVLYVIEKKKKKKKKKKNEGLLTFKFLAFTTFK